MIKLIWEICIKCINYAASILTTQTQSSPTALGLPFDDPDPDIVEDVADSLVQGSQAAVQVGHPEALEAAAADLIGLDGGHTAPEGNELITKLIIL